LARLLVEATSREDGTGAGKLDAMLHDAGRLIGKGDLPGAMEGLLAVLRQDKRYRGGEPRLALLALFELLGDSDPLTLQYRSKLASVLF
jgi:putative thioredoxin